MNIKLINCSLFILACIVQATSLSAKAQDTTYLSHLGSSDDTGIAMGSDEWLAISFETGAAPNGYSLDSIQLRIAGIEGNPSDFQLSLYGNNEGVPGNSLELLNGSDPTSAGIYAFASSSITLSPSTVYWVVTASSDSLENDNHFFWGLDPSSYTSSDGWSMNTVSIFDTRNNGSTWNNDEGGSPLTLAVNATAVPEPEIYSLIGFALFVILIQRRRQARDYAKYVV
jgi:hypothetical protein